MLTRIICVSLFAIGLMAQQPETAPPPAAPVSYRISGTVVDAVSLAPLAQTKVAIAPVAARNALRTVVTGEDGRFVFDNVARGKHSLEAQRRGYALQGFDQHEGFATAIAVGPGLVSDNLVFRLLPDASISGKIMDGQGEPVSNDAQVMLFRASVENGTLRTRVRDQAGTDDQGYFHFPHLPPGKYFVAVSARPWYATYAPPTPGASQPMPPTQPQPLDVAYPVTFYPGVTEPGDATPIVLQPGDRFVADVALRAVPAMRLRYKNSNTEASRFLHLRLAQRFFGDTETALRSQNEVGGGDVREVVGLAPGHYVVHVLSMRDPRAAGFARELDLTGNTDFDLEDAPASVSVSGTVKFEGPRGSPQPPLIQFRDTRSGQLISGPVSAGGEFQLQLPAGSYDVRVANVPELFERELVASGAKVAGRRLQISGAEAVQLTVVMSGGLGRIEGTASREGKPVAGAMVVLVPQDDPANNVPLFRRDQSDSDGTFTLPEVLPGKYTLIAIENGWELEWANPVALKKYLAAGQAIQVEANGRYKAEVNVQ